jgi:hypothetical protein
LDAPSYVKSVRESDAEKLGPKRDEVAGGWRRMYNEEIYNFYPSTSIIEVIKERRMRWTSAKKR